MEQLGKTQVLQLIVNQLQEYGFKELAGAVAVSVGVSSAFEPSSRLAELCWAGKRTEDSDDDEPIMDVANISESDNEEDASKGLYINPSQKYEPTQTPHWIVLYTANHKSFCRSSKFTADGKYVASGSADTTIKVMDVQKMNMIKADPEDKPVVKTLYDNLGTINDLSWNPVLDGLCSASDDKTVKYFDMNSPNTRRAAKCFQDSSPVRSVDFHPSGEFVLSGSDHEAPRLWEFNTGKCFVSPKEFWHKGGVTCTRFSPRGDRYISTSMDGSIKIWDGNNGKCLDTLDNAHAALPVWSVCWSKNSKYFLTNGGDGIVKLWDSSTKQVVRQYDGAQPSSSSINVTFNYNEEIIMMGDDKSAQLWMWDVKSGKHLKTVPAHQQCVRWISASPTENVFLSCGDDSKAKYWIPEGQKIE